MRPDVIVINEADNVAVAMRDLPAGAEFALPGGASLVAVVEIPLGHKVALRGLAAGEDIIKYGECIGVAAERIQPGDWIHTHNIKPA